MTRNLELVREEPPKGWADLSDELVALRTLTGTFLEKLDVGDAQPDEGQVDSLTKLVRALTTLADFTLKAEQTISAKELRELTSSMGQVVNSHVSDPATRAKIQREWLGLMSEVVG